MEQVRSELDLIRQTLAEQDRASAERRKVDDERTHAAELGRRQLLDRADGHGARLGRLEARWEAFFSDEGAFKVVLHRGVEQGKKLDRLFWLAGIGFGIIATLELILKK